MMLKFSPYFSLFVYSGFTFYILNSWKIRKFNKTSVNHFYSLCRYLSMQYFSRKSIVHPGFYSLYTKSAWNSMGYVMFFMSKVSSYDGYMTCTLHASFIIEKWTIYSKDFILIFVSHALYIEFRYYNFIKQSKTRVMGRFLMLLAVLSDKSK